MLLIFGVMGVNLLKGSYGSCSKGSYQGLNEAQQTVTLKIKNKVECLLAGGEWSVNDSNFDNIIQAMRTLFILCTTEGWAGVMFLGIDAVGPDMVSK